MKFNCSAGNHTVTASQVSGTSQPLHMTVIEVNGLDSAATLVSSSFYDGIDDGSHFSAAVGEIDTAGAAFIVTCALISGSYTARVAGSGFSLLSAPTSAAFYQYRDAPSVEADQRGAFSTTGSLRNATACIVAFPYASGGGTATLTGGSSAVSSWSLAAGALTAQALLSGTTPQSTWQTAAGTLSATAQMSGATAVSTWQAASGALTAGVTLTGAAAIAQWATTTGALTAHAQVTGNTAASTWAIAAGALSTAAMVTLVGDSAVASWVTPTGDMTLAVRLSGTTPMTVWTIPAGVVTQHASLAGAGAQSTWAIPMGALDAHAVLTGAGAVSQWSVVDGSLNHNITLTGLTPSSEWSVAGGSLRTSMYGYTVVRVVGEGLSMTAARNESLRQTTVTDALGAARATNEGLE